MIKLITIFYRYKELIKSFNTILAISLSVHNYFYLAKFLDISAKPFFSCNNSR